MVQYRRDAHRPERYVPLGVRFPAIAAAGEAFTAARAARLGLDVEPTPAVLYDFAWGVFTFDGRDFPTAEAALDYRDERFPGEPS